MQIAEAWLEKRGLRADDHTRVVIRKPIGAALISLRTAKLARNEGPFRRAQGLAP